MSEKVEADMEQPDDVAIANVIDFSKVKKKKKKKVKAPAGEAAAGATAAAAQSSKCLII